MSKKVLKIVSSQGCIACIMTLWLLAGIMPTASAQTWRWKLADTLNINGVKPVVLGSPRVFKSQRDTAIFFDGLDDGLIVPVNPVAGFKAFTVQILFKPDGDGPAAPRMIHFEDTAGNRGTIEGRIIPGGKWYLDVFLKNGVTKKGVTLIDSTILHPTDMWYWVALVYDGKKMTSYVNGTKELEGVAGEIPMGTGNTALAVRLNKVNWFKGLISEVLFQSGVVNESGLKKL